MSELHTDHAHGDHAHGDHGGLGKKKIWQVFFILLALTVVEFIIALWAIPAGYMSQHIGNYIYIILTLFKAYYIIAYFMHLKYEKVGLILSVSIVFLFIVYFIVLMLIEGDFLHLHMPLV